MALTHCRDSDNDEKPRHRANTSVPGVPSAARRMAHHIDRPRPGLRLMDSALVLVVVMHGESTAEYPICS